MNSVEVTTTDRIVEGRESSGWKTEGWKHSALAMPCFGTWGVGLDFRAGLGLGP